MFYLNLAPHKILKIVVYVLIIYLSTINVFISGMK